VLVALLACCTRGEASSGRRRAAARAGFVDLEITGRSSPRLEALVAEQRFVEAFRSRRRAASRSDPSAGLGAFPETLARAPSRRDDRSLGVDQATAEDVLARPSPPTPKVLLADDPAIIETLLGAAERAVSRGPRRGAERVTTSRRTLLGRSV
jgi:hypothetical protein